MTTASSTIELPPEIAGFAHAQRIAQRVAHQVFDGLEVGVSERDVVAELTHRLQREGVRSWLHTPFVWFGERSGFLGFRTPFDFFPTRRKLRANEVVCADMAPVIDGYSADYGWSHCFGREPQFAAMQQFDESLRERLIEILADRPTGRELVDRTKATIEAAGYRSQFHNYPFGILGHRLERVRNWDRFAVGRPFQLPTIGLHLAQLGRGIMPLLNRRDRQQLRGVWAIQPHISNDRFGLKFEDLLWVHDEGAQWLSQPLAKQEAA